jgi:MoaA/NifB/PqqE/SkfB family radical SAM enzyme
LRGDVYERVVRNIEQSRHGSIYINFTISRENHDIFEEAAEEILKIRNIRGILFHIFTPYKGSDPDLKLTAEEKDRVLGRLLKIKRKHPVRIFNTFDGLRAMRSKDWDRPIWASIVSNRGQIGPCCCREGIYDKEICEECGCTPAVETYVLQEGKVLAGMENLRFI